VAPRAEHTPVRGLRSCVAALSLSSAAAMPIDCAEKRRRLWRRSGPGGRHDRPWPHQRPLYFIRSPMATPETIRDQTLYGLAHGHGRAIVHGRARHDGGLAGCALGWEGGRGRGVYACVRAWVCMLCPGEVGGVRAGPGVGVQIAPLLPRTRLSPPHAPSRALFRARRPRSRLGHSRHRGMHGSRTLYFILAREPCRRGRRSTPPPPHV